MAFIPTAAEAGNVVVTVAGVADGSGNVLVALCTEATFLKVGCPYTASAPAAAGRVEVTIANVPPGTYAVQAFHDANANLDLDRSFFGTPREGMGFGNDARMRFGPPDFDEAAITVGASDSATTLTLRYFD